MCFLHFVVFSVFSSPEWRTAALWMGEGIGCVAMCLIMVFLTVRINWNYELSLTRAELRLKKSEK